MINTTIRRTAVLVLVATIALLANSRSAGAGEPLRSLLSGGTC
jgi:hypothetical protein